MQPIARIQVLGQVDLSLGGVRVPPLESARAESLLAFRVLHRQAAASRQHLAFLFVVGLDRGAGAHQPPAPAAHPSVPRLPDADRYLEVTSRTVGWRADARCWLDVSAFEELLDVSGDSKDWLPGERERLRQRQLDALEKLATVCAARGDLEDAIRARRAAAARRPVAGAPTGS